MTCFRKRAHPPRLGGLQRTLERIPERHPFTFPPTALPFRTASRRREKIDAAKDQNAKESLWPGRPPIFRAVPRKRKISRLLVGIAPLVGAPSEAGLGRPAGNAKLIRKLVFFCAAPNLRGPIRSCWRNAGLAHPIFWGAGWLDRIIDGENTTAWVRSRTTNRSNRLFRRDLTTSTTAIEPPGDRAGRRISPQHRPTARRPASDDVPFS